MEASLTLQPDPEFSSISTVEAENLSTADFNPTVGIHPSKPFTDYAENDKSKSKHKKKKKKVDTEDVSSSSCSSPLPNKSTRVAYKLRSPTVRVVPLRRSPGERALEALALPLGISIAAFVNTALDKNTEGQNLSPENLPMICTSAVNESLSDVYRDKFECFLRNFETSFGTTLRTLRSINNASRITKGPQISHQYSERLISDGTLDTLLDQEVETRFIENKGDGTLDTLLDQEVETRFIGDKGNSQSSSIHEDMNELACVPFNLSGSLSLTNNMSTGERSIIEKTRANDLKTVELGLKFRKLKLKETELALQSDSNSLSRSKIVMGVSKASFRAEKFKTELGDTKHGELLKNCTDCLVAGLFIMSFSLFYGAYTFSFRRIKEATFSCQPSKESNSWWIPKQVTSINSGMNNLWCYFQVFGKLIFGLLLIVGIIYLLIQRSGPSKQTMPITFVLLLGVGCGVTGKFSIDTLGGSGYHWILLWETLCVIYFVANVFTSALYTILYGPLDVCQGIRSKPVIPYWIRRWMFFCSVLLFLPLLCGLIPFAGFVEWKDHILQFL